MPQIMDFSYNSLIFLDWTRNLLNRYLGAIENCSFAFPAVYVRLFPCCTYRTFWRKFNVFTFLLSMREGQKYIKHRINLFPKMSHHRLMLVFWSTFSSTQATTKRNKNWSYSNNTKSLSLMRVVKFVETLTLSRLTHWKNLIRPSNINC